MNDDAPLRYDKMIRWTIDRYFPEGMPSMPKAYERTMGTLIAFAWFEGLDIDDLMQAARTHSIKICREYQNQPPTNPSGSDGV